LVAEMSSGLALQTNVGRDHLGIELEPTSRSHRGSGLRWSLDGPDVRIAAGATPYSEPIDVLISDEAISWSEGPLLEVSGNLLGRGFQWYTPMRSERGGAFYASQM